MIVQVDIDKVAKRLAEKWFEEYYDLNPPEDLYTTEIIDYGDDMKAVYQVSDRYAYIFFAKELEYYSLLDSFILE